MIGTKDNRPRRDACLPYGEMRRQDLDDFLGEDCNVPSEYWKPPSWPCWRIMGVIRGVH